MRLLHGGNDHGDGGAVEGNSETDGCGYCFEDEPTHLPVLQLSEISQGDSSRGGADAKGGGVKASLGKNTERKNFSPEPCAPPLPSPLPHFVAEREADIAPLAGESGGVS